MDPITMQATPGGEETLLGILQRLRDLSQQPVVPQNPMAQLGTVLQGFSAGAQGQPNPALQMFQQQRQQEVQGLAQQAHIGGTLTTLQHQKMQMDQEREKQLMSVYQHVLEKSPTPEGRLWAAEGLLNYGQTKFKVQPPPGLAMKLAAKKLTPDEEKMILTDLTAGIPPETIHDKIPNFQMTDLPYYQQLSGNSMALKARGLPLPAELAEAARLRSEAVAKSQLERIGLSGTGPVAEEARNFVTRTYKKPPELALPEEAAAGLAHGHAREDQREARRKAQSDRTYALQSKALDLAAGRVSGQQFQAVIRPLIAQSTALENVRRLSALVDALPNLPAEGAKASSVLVAEWKRAWNNPTEKNLVAFKQLWGPIIVGQLDRETYGEKGVRAMQAFQKQFDLLDRLPSRTALKNLFRIYEDSISSAMQMTGKAASAVNLTPDVHALIAPILSHTTLSPIERELEKDY